MCVLYNCALIPDSDLIPAVLTYVELEMFLVIVIVMYIHLVNASSLKSRARV